MKRWQRMNKRSALRNLKRNMEGFGCYHRKKRYKTHQTTTRTDPQRHREGQRERWLVALHQETTTHSQQNPRYWVATQGLQNNQTKQVWTQSTKARTQVKRYGKRRTKHEGNFGWNRTRDQLNKGWKRDDEQNDRYMNVTLDKDEISDEYLHRSSHSTRFLFPTETPSPGIKALSRNMKHLLFGQKLQVLFCAVVELALPPNHHACWLSCCTQTFFPFTIFSSQQKHTRAFVHAPRKQNVVLSFFPWLPCPFQPVFCEPTPFVLTN